MTKGRIALLVGLFLFETAAFAIDPREYAVEVSCTAQTSPPALVLSWPKADYVRQYWVRRKPLAQSGWSDPIATLPAESTGFTDTQVSAGSAFEYEIQMETTAPAYEGGFISAYSYIYAGLQAPLSDLKGKVLVLVDAAVSPAIQPELSTFTSDLTGAGYAVALRTVDRDMAVPEVKNLIRDEYDADPANFRSVVLLGHIPVAYSGDIYPDLHEAHRGAWPADVYYADLDGTWTDTTVSSAGGGDYPWESNYPGDGKFDQSEIPATIRIELGRIDFYDMPSFAPLSESDLLKRYLQKDHAFRHRLFTAPRRAIMHDNFGDLDGDAPAVDAWRHFTGFFGPGNITPVGPGQLMPALNAQSYLWAYGCGGGEQYQADGVGSTTDFATGDPKAVFFILHGSYFGDWDFTDNFLRAALGSPSMSLVSIWSGIPHWYLHHMALGMSAGFSTRVSQNNRGLYKSYRNLDPGEVHIALMGDPTLEMFPVAPPGNLAAAAGSSVTLSWSPSGDDNIVGYHVYSSGSASGPYTRLTETPIAATSYNDSPSPGEWHYMVRAVKLETTGSGSFYNASQGVFASATVSNGGTPPVLPVVTISVVIPDASESGPAPGVFEVTRDSAGSVPLTVPLLIGGTASNGTDYGTVAGSVTIAAGNTSADVIVAPLADGLIEGDETVTIQLGLSAAYTTGTPATAMLKIKDNPPKEPPAAADQHITTFEDVPKSIQLTATDPLGAPVVFTIKSNPKLGTLSGTPPNLTYNPSANANGSDSFTFVASNGQLQSAPATVFITITPVNDPPAANGLSVLGAENSPISINLAASDIEAAELNYKIITPAAHGTVAVQGNIATYTPNSNYIGPDSFIFEANDGLADSNPATVSIMVQSGNHPPVAKRSSITVAEDSAASIQLNADDPDGGSLIWTITAMPLHGTLSGSPPNVSYVPSPNYTGSDTFSFKVGDGALESAPAEVAITVAPVNDVPAGASQTIQLNEDSPATFVVLHGTDIDGDPLTFRITAAPQHGELIGTGANLTYQPAANYNGTDSFSYVVNDGTTDSPAATITLVIASVDDAPAVAAPGNVVTGKNRAIPPLEFTVSDADSDPANLQVFADSSNAALISANGISLAGTGLNRSIAIQPAAGASGTTTITVRVSDGALTGEASFDVTVTNSPPQANDDDFFTTGPLSLSTAVLLKNDTDADGDALSISAIYISGIEHGALTFDGSSFNYTPKPGYVGVESFSYSVQDSSGATSIGTVRIHAGGEPKISAVALDGSGVVLKIAGSPGAAFQVLYSTDTRTWSQAGSGTTDQNGNAEFRDSEIGVPCKFYQVEWP